MKWIRWSGLAGLHRYKWRLAIYALAVILHSSLITHHSFAQGVITTVAGTTWVLRGDGGPAVNAPLGGIGGLAVDAAGNIFAGDRGNNLVVKISPTGVLTVVAGNGIPGFSGDGGSATSAQLTVDGIALDTGGNVYVAAAFNRIRKVSPDGIITTVAGGGNLGDGGPATSASLNLGNGSGVTVDASGNLYIAETGNHRIRKVSPAGIITTVAGNGIRGFSGDGGPATNASLNLVFGAYIAVDAAGNLYIPDSGNSRLRKVSSGGIITTVAGTGFGGSTGDGGPAFSARLNFPPGVALDGASNLYIAESGGGVRKVSSAGIISTVAGSGVRGFSGDGGPATNASLGGLRGGLAVDTTGNLYIGDTENNRVRKVNTSGIISTIAGNGLFRFGGDGGPATAAFLNFPTGMAVDVTGNLYIADSNNHRVRKVAPNDTITTFAGTGIPSFSGDGAPATSASLNRPSDVAVDRAGSLYIADVLNTRIRKVSPGGIITTFAGGGTDLRDGIPAISASLGTGGVPAGVALDAAGNLFLAEPFGQRIRKVSPSGIITTVAGNGIQGFSGDGGPAINGSLNGPQAVTVDSSGNLYIADTENRRIRKVDTRGIITTVAGNGAPGFSGDGGPAINASLRLGPGSGLAVDASGNLYFADGNNGRVRKVSADGIITTFAGGGNEPGDGGPATSASLQGGPTGVTLDASGNAYIGTGDGRIRKVLAGTPTFSVTPTRLSFSAPAGAAAVAPQQILVSSTVLGLQWRAEPSTESGGAWLSVSPLIGTAPGAISVSVNATALEPGIYRGTVTVQAPFAAPPTQTVAVELTVGTASPAQLSVEPASLTFEIPAGASQPQAQTLRISNGGSGALDWIAQASTTSGGNWLRVSPGSGSATAASPATVQVTAEVAGLALGVYSGSVSVESPTTGQTQTVAVTLLLSQVQTILVSQSGLLFTGVEGGTVVPSQSFGILNIGQGVMNWAVAASTLSGGNWLNVTPASGRSEAGSLQIPLVDVGVNVTGLRAGAYSGLVRVSAPGANNSPQLVTVYLNVLPAGSNPGVLVRPTGLIFAAQAGTSSPGSQLVRVATAAAGSIEFLSGVLAFGGEWLEVAPRNAVVAAADPRTITVQPTLGSLASGVYRGTLTLLFKEGSPTQVVNILFLVVPRATAAASAALLDGRGSEVHAPLDEIRNPQSEIRNFSEQPCVPQRLHAVHRTLGSNFTSPVGWPSPIEVQVVDDCGAAVANAAVVASFTNGDPPLTLASLRNGTYVGTWRPVNAAAQVTVTVRANLPPLAAVEVQALGQVRDNPTAPALFARGIVNGASFARGGVLAPGSIVSVFGRNLARGLNHSLRLPLEKTLGGATLSVGGLDVPLFFSSDGQINAQLPFEVAVATRPQVVVKARREGTGPEAITVPETITIAPVQPGIFSTNQQGTGQGAILDGQGRLVDSAAPARTGEVVQVFCTGLGATEPRVASGEPAPAAEPLARVVTPVEARVGGRAARVLFAGLAPGFVGLYQVNVEIPEGVEPGPEVPLVILQNAVPSNTVTLAIR